MSPTHTDASHTRGCALGHYENLASMLAVDCHTSLCSHGHPKMNMNLNINVYQLSNYDADSLVLLNHLDQSWSQVKVHINPWIGSYFANYVICQLLAGNGVSNRIALMSPNTTESICIITDISQVQLLKLLYAFHFTRNNKVTGGMEGLYPHLLGPLLYVWQPHKQHCPTNLRTLIKTSN